MWITKGSPQNGIHDAVKRCVRADTQTERQGGTGDNTADTSKDIMEKAAEWGGLTQRERDAIIQGTSEKIIQKYKKLTDDYYEMMGKKGSESR